MNLFLILPSGEQRPLEDFVAHTLMHAQAGDAGALDVLDHAQCVAVEVGAAEASRLIVHMRNRPERIGALLKSAPPTAVAMLGAMLARTFTDLHDGAEVGAVPENADDRALIASIHDAPPIEQ